MDKNYKFQLVAVSFVQIIIFLKNCQIVGVHTCANYVQFYAYVCVIESKTDWHSVEFSNYYLYVPGNAHRFYVSF